MLNSRESTVGTNSNLHSLKTTEFFHIFLVSSIDNSFIERLVPALLNLKLNRAKKKHTLARDDRVVLLFLSVNDQDARAKKVKSGL